ncbi:LamG-like jellyroll fold domain-containing protein [Brumimicrobium aurantiacum]|uniref:T9SS C-terminal target domain-containing protein n=1 Tax=Brumimicrobium aurantiacum TaxID=1737063 RepID=A0A3E1EWY8_9FLAO|nr:LamG-like jellyroll fold domain-containing protein [Brumimicrobium aurantiacum]RFC54075.1 T9SS C-terminal target domain-containing protein [Brumimicrobium aurantiacum]
MKKLSINLLCSICILLFSFYTYSQTTFNVPEILYYKFDQSGTMVTNHANPGSSGSGTINGSLSQSGIGQFGSALEGSGVSGTTNYINTNYSTSLTGDWTISFWVNMNEPSGTRYIFGDATAGSFRCFAGGVAPTDGLVLRGTGWTDLEIPNVLGVTGGSVVTITYTASTGMSEVFVDGVSVNSEVQSTNLTISGSNFSVGSYGGSSNTGLDGQMDEFRLYNRALSVAEISSTYNQTLPLNIVCGVITNTSFSNVTATSFDFTWDHGSGNDDYIFEYGPAGFTPGTGLQSTGTITGTSTTESITGLTPNTDYSVIITENCNNGNDDYTLGPISIRTACGVEVAPFYEGFNSAAQPTCWENLSSDPSTSVNNFWNFNDQGDYGAANNGKNAGEFTKVDGNSPYSDSVMLVTPLIDISQLNTPYLSFEWFSNNTNNPGDNVPLIIEVFDGSSWNLIDTLRGDSTEWIFVNYDLSTYQGNDIKVRFMVNKSVTNSYSWYNDILLDEIRVDDCISLGGQDGSVNVCAFQDTIDLNNGIITKPNGGGIWSFPNEPAFLTQDSVFNFEYLTPGSYDVYYVERYVCYDTTIATINVYDESKAGEDGTVEVCMNQPIDLIGILSGQIDLGGEWYDFSGSLLTTQQPIASNVPGTYNYTYIADNGVCPADTSIAEVVVRSDCDYLSIEGEMFTELSVYPNPATSQLHIVNPSNTSDLKIEMLDMNGRVVLVENQALNNATKTTLSIDELENGVYTLRVYNNEGYKTFKVVKQ